MLFRGVEINVDFFEAGIGISGNEEKHFCKKIIFMLASNVKFKELKNY